MSIRGLACPSVLLVLFLGGCSSRESVNATVGSPELNQCIDEARGHLAAGDPNGALAVVDAYLATAPDESLALLVKGQILLAQRRPKDADEALTRALAKSGPGESDALALRGIARVQIGHKDAAREDLERAASIDPFSLLAQQNLSTLYLELGRSEDALAAAERAVALGGGQLEPALAKARALAALGKHVEARPIVEDLIRRAPEDQRVQETLGRVYLDLGMHAEARPLLQRVVEKAPRNGIAWFQLARATLELEELEAAGQALEKCRELGLHGPEVAELEQRLAEARAR